MAGTEGTKGSKLKGFNRRVSGNGEVTFEARFRGGRFNHTVESKEVAAIAYDLLKLHSEVEGKESRSLNYPAFSRSLVLDPLPSGFDIRRKDSKKEGLEVILKQARVAAKNLPENLRQPAVASPSPINGSSSLVPAGPSLSQEISVLPQSCGISEISADISLQPSCSNELAGLEKHRLLEQLREAEARYLGLLKLVEDRDLEFITEGLHDGNESCGRSRADQPTGLQKVPESVDEGKTVPQMLEELDCEELDWRSWIVTWTGGEETLYSEN